MVMVLVLALVVFLLEVKVVMEEQALVVAVVELVIPLPKEVMVVLVL